MYEFLVLVQLARGPRHGYRIAKVIDNIVGPFRKLQWGALYPVLARLEAEGFIVAEREVEQGDGRQRKVYALTATGRRRLHDLLMDTEHHLAEYDDLFAHKVTVFSELQPEERVYLCRHYAVHARQNIDHIDRKLRLLREEASSMLTPEQMRNIETVMDHRRERWEMERRWAERLISEYQSIEEAV
jgi:DNA-binding PadR family transcriptional regulator